MGCLDRMLDENSGDITWIFELTANDKMQAIKCILCSCLYLVYLNLKLFGAESALVAWLESVVQ